MHTAPRTMLAALLVLATTVVPAPAQPTPELTNAQAYNLIAAMRALDAGYMVIVNGPGGKTAVQTPWEFNSALLRLRIKRNIRALEPVVRSIDEARSSTALELLKTLKPNDDGKMPASIDESPAARTAFQTQMNELLAKPVGVPVDLGRILASELKLDKNEIPLEGLDPILEDNISPPPKK